MVRSIIVLLFIFLNATAFSQDNYEIQVYNSETLGKGLTDIELHSNFTPAGNKNYSENIFPSDKIFHETLEITHGFSNNFELGFYFFNALGDHGRSGYGGSHIRPRIKAPDSWHLPVGLSLSSEIGYQRLGFFNSHWSWEIHPIIDKQIGNLYISINPTFDWDLNKSAALEFSPSLATTYKLSTKMDLGFEWYSGYGPITEMVPWNQQNQLLFLATNLEFGKNWEFNAGIGRGLNDATDAWIIKCILGRTFGF